MICITVCKICQNEENKSGKKYLEFALNGQCRQWVKIFSNPLPDDSQGVDPKEDPDNRRSTTWWQPEPIGPKFE